MMDEWERTIQTYLTKSAPKKTKQLDFLLQYYNYLRRKLRSATIYREIQIITFFLSFLDEKNKSVYDVEYRDVEEFLARIQGKRNTIRRYAATIKKLLKYLYKMTDKRYYKEVYEKIELPPQEKRIPDVLTREEFYKILNNIDNLCYRTAIAITYEGGLRLDEVRNIRLKDVSVNEDHVRIIIRRSKSEPRPILIIEFKDLILKWLECHVAKHEPNAFLFYSTNPLRKMGRGTLYAILKTAATKAGIKKNVYVHLLRHSRATELYKFMKEKEMMRWFGWKTREMLDVYAHLVHSDVEKKYLSIYGKAPQNETLEKRIKKCPNCGFENSPIALFCSRCGHILSEEFIAKRIKEEVSLRSQLEELQKVVSQLAREIAKLKRK